MQRADYPATRDLVLVGGGHCHALVLRRWGMNPLPGARLTLISPGPTAPYTGMLPGLVAGHYRAEELQIDLVRLARFAGARLILGRAVAMDRVAQRITVPGRADVVYDVAALDVGITSDMPDLPGFADWGAAAKPLDDFAARWEAAVARLAGKPAALVVLGGGVAGVELALAMAERLARTGAVPRVQVIEAGPVLLPGLAAGARAAVLAAAEARGIALLTGVRAVRVEEGAVILADGRRIASDFTVGAAGARPQDWLRGTGLVLEAGFVAVGPSLQSVSDPQIFASGDCAHLTHAPRPKAGVFAVRQAPVLFHNLRAAVQAGQRTRDYWPQRNYLKLISTGGKTAVADSFGLRATGPLLWQWKDRIDRRFMAKFSDLNGMAAPAPVLGADGLAEMLAGKPLCGGCGAKVGPLDLRAGLAGVPAPGRADVVSGPGDDAAVLRQGTGFQVISTDHLRAVTDDPWLMARIAAVHGLGDIQAMGAAPQVALSQIILPRMSAALQARTLAEISAGAASVFGPLGVDIVGGHTSIGAELTVGFTLTGLMPGPPLGKGGAKAGDVLVLTKPLGVGVILAAAMAGQAPGAVVAGVWASMVEPQSALAGELAAVAHAMTDVTGFGLAGHLSEMLEASGVAAEVDLDSVPLLPGAEALAALGVRSSLYAANRAAVAVAGVPAGARGDLLFDPQTGGGLLAAVPADRVAGLGGVVIGRLVAGVPGIRVYALPRGGDGG